MLRNRLFYVYFCYLDSIFSLPFKIVDILYAENEFSIQVFALHLNSINITHLVEEYKSPNEPIEITQLLYVFCFFSGQSYFYMLCSGIQQI